MSEKLCVMKFGGTSVRNAECIWRVSEIVAAAARQRPVVVVVSAMSGVTNSLIEAAQRSASGDDGACVEIATNLRRVHLTALRGLICNEDRIAQRLAEAEHIITEAANFCWATALLRELTPRTLDVISGAGERLSTQLVGAALSEVGLANAVIEATELIVTDDAHGDAEPLMSETRVRTRERLLPLISSGTIPVVTGFIGATLEATLTTLGRGASDYSATILGAVLDAEEIIIWTDVDGILTADPRLVPEARTLLEISYHEAAELAYFGAKVLHPKALRPVEEMGIPVWIRNTFAPDQCGTKITPGDNTGERRVRAVTARSDVGLITIGGLGLVEQMDAAATVFTTTAATRVHVLLILQSSSRHHICLVVNATDTKRTVEALRRAFSSKLAQHKVEHITVKFDVALVAVVGERVSEAPEIIGGTLLALGNAGVNVVAVAQGSSDYNVSLVIEEEAMHRAVAAVHKEFGLARLPPALEEMALSAPNL
jgi:aspartate kinase